MYVPNYLQCPSNNRRKTDYTIFAVSFCLLLGLRVSMFFIRIFAVEVN